MKNLLIVTILTLSFSGCTVPVNFYLRNLSDDFLVIEAYPMNLETNKDFSLKYENQILDINFSLHQSMGQVLVPQQEYKTYLEYRLPPRSTCHIGFGANFNNFTFSKIILKKGNKELEKLNWESKTKYKTGKVFFNKFYAWYDAE